MASGKISKTYRFPEDGMNDSFTDIQERTVLSEKKTMKIVNFSIL